MQDRYLVLRSNLSHSFKTYDITLTKAWEERNVHTNPRSHQEPHKTSSKITKQWLGWLSPTTSTDTAHLQLIQSKPRSLTFHPGKMMLCGWWSPKACQDNGSNASAVPLNYCVCVSQRHYLTQDYLACQRKKQAVLSVARNPLVWYVTWEIFSFIEVLWVLSVKSFKSLKCE